MLARHKLPTINNFLPFDIIDSPIKKEGSYKHYVNNINHRFLAQEPLYFSTPYTFEHTRHEFENYVFINVEAKKTSKI